MITKTTANVSAKVWLGAITLESLKQLFLASLAFLWLRNLEKDFLDHAVVWWVWSWMSHHHLACSLECSIVQCITAQAYKISTTTPMVMYQKLYIYILNNCLPFHLPYSARSSRMKYWGVGNLHSIEIHPQFWRQKSKTKDDWVSHEDLFSCFLAVPFSLWS